MYDLIFSPFQQFPGSGEPFWLQVVNNGGQEAEIVITMSELNFIGTGQEVSYRNV